jgi:hypothetical protein
MNGVGDGCPGCFPIDDSREAIPVETIMMFRTAYR